MKTHEQLIEWLESELEKYRGLLDAMEKGELRIGSRELGGPWVHDTEQTIENDQRIVATLEKQLSDLRNRAGQ